MCFFNIFVRPEIALIIASIGKPPPECVAVYNFRSDGVGGFTCAFGKPIVFAVNNYLVFMRCVSANKSPDNFGFI